MKSSLGCYRALQAKRTIEFRNGRRFTVIVYRAYDIDGVIHLQNNGIAILDDDQRKVVCDGIAVEKVGMPGALDRQMYEFEEICAMRYCTFRRFLNQHPRSRFQLEPHKGKPKDQIEREPEFIQVPYPSLGRTVSNLVSAR